MGSGKEYLSIMHSMCIMELQHLMDNIIGYERRSTKILHKITESWHDINENNNPEELIAYDTFCSNVSEITNLARKFNLHFRLHNLGSDEPSAINGDPVQSSHPDVGKRKPPDPALNSKTLLPVQLQTQLDFPKETPFVDKNPVSSVSESPPQIITNGHASLSATEEENLALEVSVNEQSPPAGYVNKDLSVYLRDNVLTATVTHIKNLNKLQFFVCDVGPDSKDTAKIAQLSKMKHLVQYGRFSMPAKNEIFGLVLDDVIVRAARLDNKKNESSAVLLDLGEMIQISVKNIMYSLSPGYQKLPAQAIPCVLQAEGNADKAKLRTLLESWEYQTLKLQVIRNDGKTLYVKSLADAASNDKVDCATKLSQLSPTNPFYMDLLAGVEEKVQPEEKVNKLQFSGEPSDALSHGASNQSGPNGLTPEELEMLYEETPCTSNAMKAVMGYDPKDDQRICRFYNPKTMSCFKGSSCRQEHSLLLKDGWTKDVKPISSLIDTRSPVIVYSVGTIINITPTYISDLECFYCQVNDSNLNTEPIIFTDEDISDMGCELLSAPLVFDLVLCRYQDGFWYRAKIMESDEVGKMFKVFYVDYGNQEIVHIRNLAYCDYATAHWPFQAILCHLADVKKTSLTSEKRKEATNTLRDCILNKHINVKVVFHREELFVHIIDEQCKNLNKRLTEMGCFKPVK